jgi:hypothetical protein
MSWSPSGTRKRYHHELLSGFDGGGGGGGAHMDCETSGGVGPAVGGRSAPALSQVGGGVRAWGGGYEGGGGGSSSTGSVASSSSSSSSVSGTHRPPVLAGASALNSCGPRKAAGDGPHDVRDPDVQFFQNLLRFRTVSAEGAHNGAYVACVNFLEAKCRSIGLLTIKVVFAPNKPILLATRLGTRPDLPAVLLNSHYDVVPVMPEYWSVDPFAGAVVSGRVWGRGAQDMKSVCAQYLLALERLRHEPLERTVHVSFVPDEEVGGADGMASLVRSDAFRRLGPIAVALDEGLATENDDFTVFYGERMSLCVIIY